MSTSNANQESDMEIDWEKIHDELGPEYVAVVWTQPGSCAAFSSKNVFPNNLGGWYCNEHASVRFIDWLTGQCPGEWDKVLLEFPGHYFGGNKPELYQSEGGPICRAGDPVGFIADLSGNGNHLGKPAFGYVDLIDLTTKLSEVIDAGKEAAAKLKKLDAVIKSFDEWRSANNNANQKRLDAAGLEIMFREKV